MTDEGETLLSKPLDDATARLISDRASLIMAQRLPRCVARRYDISTPCNYWPIELCFANQGPIAPLLSFAWGKYYTLTGLYVIYQLMFRDALDYANTLSGPRIPESAEFAAGSEALAEALLDAVEKIDLQAMIAAGSIERILAERPRQPTPWPNIGLAQCAVYLGKYDEANVLAENALKYAIEDGSSAYQRFVAEAKLILKKLDSDADLLRRELTHITRYNWSHFKVISQ